MTYNLWQVTHSWCPDPASHCTAPLGVNYIGGRVTRLGFCLFELEVPKLPIPGNTLSQHHPPLIIPAGSHARMWVRSNMCETSKINEFSEISGPREPKKCWTAEGWRLIYGDMAQTFAPVALCVFLCCISSIWRAQHHFQIKTGGRERGRGADRIHCALLLAPFLHPHLSVSCFVSNTTIASIPHWLL